MTASNCGANLLVKTGDIYLCAIGYDFFTPRTLVYTDPYGRVYTIGGGGSLNSIKDVAGNLLSVTANGICAGALAGDGTCPSTQLGVPFVRDTQGRITQISFTDPVAHRTDVYGYSYDSNGNLQRVSYPLLDAGGNPIHADYTYDTTHLYTGGTDPLGHTLPATTYDTSGKLQSVTTKPDGTHSYTTSYVYGTTPITVTYPDAVIASGLETTITNPADANGVVGQTRVLYDRYGKVIRSIDPLGHTTLNEYDGNHNLISVTDPLGHTTTYGYDNNGNRTSVKLPGLAATTTQYNPYSEPTQTTDAVGNIRQFFNDANFWPRLASDTIGPVVSFVFNANGTMASKAVGYDLTATPGAATSYTYDPYGNLQSQTDPLRQQTTYTYDGYGRLLATTPPIPSGATAASV